MMLKVSNFRIFTLRRTYGDSSELHSTHGGVGVKEYGKQCPPKVNEFTHDLRKGKWTLSR